MQIKKIQCQYTVEELQHLVKKVCHNKQISLYANRLGPKIYTEHQFVALNILYARSNLSLRDFVQGLYESKWPEWLNLQEIPSKSSIHRHFNRIGLTIIRMLNKIVTKTKKLVDFAIDSTGLEINQSSKHYEKRINRTRSPFLKLSILAENKQPYLIHDFIAEQKHTHDVLHAKTLCKRFGLKNRKIFADKAYDCEELMELVEENDNFLYCPIRNMNRNRPRGRLRRKIFDSFDKNIYHKGRNPIEMVMFLLKQKGLIIRARKSSNKIKEIAWKILAYNIVRLTKSLQDLFCLKPFGTRPFV